jgi:hypothetical protein
VSKPGRFSVAAAYSVSGSDVDVEHITRSTGLVPSRALVRGRPLPNGIIGRTNLWQIRTPFLDDPDPNVALRQLIETLAPAWSALVEVGRNYRAAAGSSTDWRSRAVVLVSVIVEINADRPTMAVDLDVLRKIVDLSAMFEFDVYDLRHDEPQET